MKSRSCAAAAAAAACCLGAFGASAQTSPTAQPPAAPTPAAEAAPATATAPAPVAAPAAPAPAATVAPRAVAGTVIELEITQLVSSKTNKRGDTFTLRLAQPLTAADQVLIPAGTPGMGEVIDVGHPGMAGTPGKLVLAGRYLDYQGQHIPIRAFKVGGAGKDHTALATGVVIAVGLPGMFITGGNIEIPAGTIANAKLGADYPAATAPASPTASATESPAAKPADQGNLK